MSTIIRDNDIHVSAFVRWSLVRIAKASGGQIHELADNILTKWITKAHPELAKLWQQRQEIDEGAQKAIEEKDPPPF